MFNLGALMKAAKGGAIDPATLKPMLEAMGVKLDLQPVLLKDGREAFGTLAEGAGKPGAALHRLTGTLKNGGRIEALIVLIPS